MSTSHRIDPAPAALDDQALVASLHKVLSFERRATAAFIEHLAELDARGLYRDAGYSSLYTYCTGALRLSEAESYARIHAARLCRRLPVLLTYLRQDDLNLTTLQVLGPKLDEHNQHELLEAAKGLSRRKVEELLAARFPQPDVPEVVRKLPTPRTAAAAPAEMSLPLLVEPARRPAGRPTAAAPCAPVPKPATVAPLSAERFKVQLTFSREQRDKLNTARDLLRHAQPDGDLAQVIERGLDLLIEEQLKRRFAVTDKPRKASRAEPKAESRYVPSVVRRAVFERDALCCTFVSKDGMRCTERGWLELHHELAFARGGPPTEANLRMLCRSHNQLLAERDFGPLFMQQRRATLAEQSSQT